jgi:hypothetical protein
MAGALRGDQQQFGPNVNGHSMPMANGGTGVGSNDALTNNLAGMSKHQLYEVMVQMKMLIQQNQQQARQVLIANPQLTKALFQAQIILGMVHPPQMVSHLCNYCYPVLNLMQGFPDCCVTSLCSKSQCALLHIGVQIVTYISFI